MRKYIFVIIFTLIFSGCSLVNNKKEVVRDEITCFSDDSSFVLTIEDGKIIKYVDSNDGDLGQETIDIINSEHLINIDNNDDALKIMDNVMKDLGGSCGKKEE